MASRAEFVLVFLFCFFLISRNAVVDCIRPPPDPYRIDRDASVCTHRVFAGQEWQNRRRYSSTDAKPDEIASLKITYAYTVYARARCLVTAVSVVRNSPFPSATRNAHRNRPNSTSNTNVDAVRLLRLLGRYRRTDEGFHVFRNTRNVPMLGDRRVRLKTTINKRRIETRCRVCNYSNGRLSFAKVVNGVRFSGIFRSNDTRVSVTSLSLCCRIAFPGEIVSF